MYGKGHNSCSKKKEDTYIMDVGKFAKAYVGQKQVDYKYMGNNYGNPDALDYVTCTAVQYNDAYVSVKIVPGLFIPPFTFLVTSVDECGHGICTSATRYFECSLITT